MMRFRFLLALLLVSVATGAYAFEPSSSNPYTFTGTSSCSTCETFAHTKVGDGLFHAPGCGQSGSPLYWCDCSIGYSAGEMLQPPILRVVGNNVELEYFARNAYCNPPADGGDIHEPLSIPFRINVVELDPETMGVIRTAHVVPPYWEHGKVTMTDLSPSCKLYRAIYIVMSTTSTYAVSSNVAGATGSNSGKPCLVDLNSCPIGDPGGAFGNGGPPRFNASGMSPSTNRPINIGSGNMQYSEPLFSVAEPAGTFDFTITYNSRDTAVGPLGLGFMHPFSQTLNSTPSSSARLWRTATGSRVLFVLETHPPVGDIYRPVWPADALGTATRNTSTDTYTFRDLANNVTTIKSHGSNYTIDTLADRWGNTFTTTYSGSNLTQLTDPLGRSWTLAYSGTLLTSITDIDGNQWRFTYDTSNRLTQIFDPLHTSTTPWRQFTWVTYDVSKPAVLAAVKDESGAVLEGHQYDSVGRATSSWIGDTTGSTPAPGTNARELLTITYTDDTHRTVTSTVDSTTSQSSVYTLAATSGRYLASSIVGNCTACGTSVDAQTFTYDDLNRPLSRTVGLDLTGSGGTDERVTTLYTYNTSGQVLTMTEASGTASQRTTTYAYGVASWPSFVTSVTRSSVAKSGQNAVTTYAWNTSGTPETTLTTTRSGYLKSTDSTATNYVTTSLFDARHRLTEVDGPGTNEKTVRIYYSDSDTTLDRRGRLQELRAFTNATAYLATTFDNYNIYGTPRTATDPNGVQTVRVTDALGRVTTVTSVKPTSDSNEPADYVTTYAYDGRDRLTSTTLPRGNAMRFHYEDGSNALLESIRADTSGLEHERSLVTMNAAMQKTTESSQECATPANPCSAWTTRRTESFAYDAHARLATVTHPDSTTAAYAYDSRGNLASIRDERHTAANTLYAYDSLNRLKSVTQKQPLVSGSDVVTQYTYDTDGNLVSVTDANALVTTYAHDDFSRLQSQTSPATGTTTHTYDAAGNLVSTTDANGATTTRTYDALRRVLTSASACSGWDTETITWTYDDSTAGDYGRGHLASMTDTSGSTSYVYERRGLLRNEDRLIGTWSSSTAYAYDADGNRTKLGAFEYTYDFAGRPASLGRRDCTSCSLVSIVSSATYYPFGPERDLAFANGTTQSRTFDTRYQMTENKLTATGPVTLVDFTHTYDGAGNMTALSDALDSTYDRTFSFDDLNRITSADTGTSLWGTAAYSYDSAGNLLSENVGAWTASLTYDSTSKRVTSATEQGTSFSVDHDAAGNEISSGYVPRMGPGGELWAFTFLTVTRTFSCRNLLAHIQTGSGGLVCPGGPPCYPPFPPRHWTDYDYTYDGRGMRVNGASSDGYAVDYVYTPELNLAFENNSLGIQHEFAWFNGHPIAQFTTDAPSSIYYTFTDALGTPIAQTDDTGSLAWLGDYEPFGRLYYLRADHGYGQPLRLPGQDLALHNDSGTEEHYNVFRWYRQGWGRYTQSDPIALYRQLPWRDTNLFAYAAQNPLRHTDTLGLFSWDDSCTECPGGANSGTDTMRKQMNSEGIRLCGDPWRFITDMALADCVASRCKDPQTTISCNNNCTPHQDIGGKIPGATAALGSLQNPASQVTLCTNNPGPRGWMHGGVVVIHEFAHLCGWPDGGGKGVPDPNTPGAPGYPRTREDYQRLLGGKGY